MSVIIGNPENFDILEGKETLGLGISCDNINGEIYWFIDTGIIDAENILDKSRSLSMEHMTKNSAQDKEFSENMNNFLMQTNSKKRLYFNGKKVNLPGLLENIIQERQIPCI